MPLIVCGFFHGWIHCYKINHLAKNKENNPVNKTELINQIAESADISKKAAGDALQAFVATVTAPWKKVIDCN